MNDEDLVAQVRAGDLQAADALLSRYQDVAYTTALRLVGQRADAEDVAQETLVRAYTHLADLESGASFAPWLRRIAVTLSLNVLRRRGLLTFDSLDAEPARDGISARDVPDATPGPEAEALDLLFRDEVEKLIQQLPAEQRVAVVLRDIYGYDVAEIAELRRCGLSAAKMRIVRGRALLRTLLTQAHVLSAGAR